MEWPQLYQGTIKKISDKGNWLVDFDEIQTRLRWVYYEDLNKLTTSELQTSSLGRSFADLEAGKFDRGALHLKSSWKIGSPRRALSICAGEG